MAFVVLTAAAFIVSCKKDENTGRLSFDSPAIYISEPGGTATVGFSAYHVSKLYISNKPTGWSEPELDEITGVLTIKAPATFTDAIAKTGTITVVGKSNEGFLISESLFVGVVPTVDLSEGSAKAANCYIASAMDTHYTFDATRKGDGSSLGTPSSVKIIWQTASSPLQYVGLVDGKASFFVGDKEAKSSEFKSGNALLGAYDAGGKLLWSWHVWITDYNPAKTPLEYSNGYTVMERNLGALNNANSTTDEILASYGLFYQWGRKEPFIGPSTYQASNGLSGAMYGSTGARVYLIVKESSATTGTAEYALQNPLTFITGVKDSQFDWLWTGHTESLWADTKTVNDPCPFGWRVAPEGAFSGLTIADDLSMGYETYENKYGWILVSGGTSSLYMGAGRRVYTNGSVQNIYNPVPADRQNAPAVRNPAMEAQPWVGYYWTTKTEQTLSGAFFFWFDKRNVAASGVLNGEMHYRANGMPVRCVKVN